MADKPAAPIYRSQGNSLFRTDPGNTVTKRGQDVPYNINGAPTGATVAWGSITGTLSSQADLSTALSGKAATGDIAASGLTSATSVIIGRSSAGTGAVQELTPAATKSLLAITASDVSGLAAVATSGSASDLASGTLASARLPAFSGGDVTSTAGSANLTIGANAVTFSKMVAATSASIVGATAAGNFAQLTPTQAKSVLAIAASDVSGLGFFATGTNAANLTGTLAAGQLPAFSGGDVTSSAGSAVLTIGANKVTFAKFVAATAAGIVGAMAAGNFAQLTAAQAKSVLAIVASDVSGLAAIATSGSASDLSAGTVAAARMPALTGDVTTSAGAVATTIANSAVTYAKIQNVTAARLLGNPTAAGAAPSEILVAGNLSFVSGTTLRTSTAASGVLVGRTTAGGGTTEEISVANGITLTALTLGLGAITPSSVATTGAMTSSSASGGVGYATGAGGAVTQLTSKSTNVALNTECGQITMNNAALAATTLVTFVCTNTSVAATDIIIVNHVSGGTFAAYDLWARAGAGQITFGVRNHTGGSLSEALVLGFAVIKATIA